MIQTALKRLARQCLPPVVWDGMRSLRKSSRRFQPASALPGPRKAGEQALDVYWDPEFADVLETWGESTVWKEIQFLLAGRRGRVLDIACGTGKVIDLLRRLTSIDTYGCDISDMLIAKGLARGIQEDHLSVCDATHLAYQSGSFDYGYSIGSLEHFTETGIDSFLKESRRVIRRLAFHMIPVSSSAHDEGWLTATQSYFNNSVAWWLPKFHGAYSDVCVIDSTWKGERSVGKWFICGSDGADDGQRATANLTFP